jgi:hypothetical protein
MSETKKTNDAHTAHDMLMNRIRLATELGEIERMMLNTISTISAEVLMKGCGRSGQTLLNSLVLYLTGRVKVRRRLERMR